MNKQKGFTIIELIVVIAIITVLAAIVMVNVTQYIARGRDAAIRANLASALNSSAVYYDGAAAGDAACLNAGILTAYNAANGIMSAGSCADDPGVFCACAGFTTGTALVPAGYCVDSRGTKLATAIDCTTECTDFQCDGN